MSKDSLDSSIDGRRRQKYLQGVIGFCEKFNEKHHKPFNFKQKNLEDFFKHFVYMATVDCISRHYQDFLRAEVPNAPPRKFSLLAMESIFLKAKELRSQEPQVFYETLCAYGALDSKLETDFNNVHKWRFIGYFRYCFDDICNHPQMISAPEEIIKETLRAPEYQLVCRLINNLQSMPTPSASRNSWLSGWFVSGRSTGNSEYIKGWTKEFIWAVQARATKIDQPEETPKDKMKAIFALCEEKKSPVGLELLTRFVRHNIQIDRVLNLNIEIAPTAIAAMQQWKSEVKNFFERLIAVSKQKNPYQLICLIHDANFLVEKQSDLNGYSIVRFYIDVLIPIKKNYQVGKPLGEMQRTLLQLLHFDIDRTDSYLNDVFIFLNKVIDPMLSDFFQKNDGLFFERLSELNQEAMQKNKDPYSAMETFCQEYPAFQSYQQFAQLLKFCLEIFNQKQSFTEHKKSNHEKVKARAVYRQWLKNKAFAEANYRQVIHEKIATLRQQTQTAAVAKELEKLANDYFYSSECMEIKVVAERENFYQRALSIADIMPRPLITQLETILSCIKALAGNNPFASTLKAFFSMSEVSEEQLKDLVEQGLHYSSLLSGIYQERIKTLPEASPLRAVSLVTSSSSLPAIPAPQPKPGHRKNPSV